MFTQASTESNDGYPNRAVGVIAGGAAVAAPTPTLVRALSSIDELNKRLRAVSSQAVEIAQAVGGPYPVDPSGIKGERPPQSAMERLNDGVSDAHVTISNLENALGAVRRALGG